jgi:hypothetical protein
MADAICRWRNTYLPTVLELISLLPKEELAQERAREIVIHNSPYTTPFYRTPCQLACQLGLYHETNGRYFPKFTFIPTEGEINSYLKNWIIHYCVPNPHTRRFNNIQPFSIHSKLCSKLLEARMNLNYEEVLLEVFEEQIGNKDILANSIESYSPIITIKKGVISLKDNKVYDDLISFTNVDINSERTNKEYFFDLFSLPNQNNERQQREGDITNVSREETAVINQLQTDPNLTETEKNQIIAARIGQGYFRRSLIYECGFCPITGVDDSSVLIASHIKPWRYSTNQERLSAKNGLLFTPTYDKLFDKGIISFTDDKRIIISSRFSDQNKVRLDILNGTRYPLLAIDGREGFMEYHRQNVFKS